MAQKLQFPVHIPFVEELGLELWAYGGGSAELRVDLADAHLNSWEVAHGGVLMTMLDVAMAQAARSAGSAASSARSAHKHDPGHGPGVVTVEMKTSFMRPAEGELRAIGKLLHRTTTLAFCEGHVHNHRGEICAHASGTFKYLRGLPADGRRIKPLRHPTRPANPREDTA